MKLIRNIFLAGLMLVFFTGSAIAQGDLISAADFMKLLKSDKSLVVIDASKAATYKKSHVKGAINIPNVDLNTDADNGYMKSNEDLAKYFGSKGVSADKPIVVTDGGDQKAASRVYCVLKYLGATNVKILHKNMAYFKKSRVPLTPMAGKKPATTFTLNVDNAFMASIDDVKSGKAILFDARDANEFAGTTEKSKGHIPGAKNLSYKDLQDADHVFLSKAEMEKVVAQYNLNADSPIIVTCQSGKRAAVLYVAFINVLEYKNVTVFDDAYNLWVEKGNSLEK